MWFRTNNTTDGEAKASTQMHASMGLSSPEAKASSIEALVSAGTLSALTRCEQARALVKSQKLALPLGVLNALSVTAIMRGGDSHYNALQWLSTITLLYCFRYAILAGRDIDIESHHDADRFFLHFLILNIMSALMWSIVPVVFIAEPNARTLYLIIVIIGLCSGATVQFGAYFLGSATLLVPILLSVIIRCVMMGGIDNIILAILTFLYLFFLLLTSVRSQRSFVHMIKLRHEALVLAASLEKEHAAAQAAAARLYHLANNDPMTGLANRAAFSAKLHAWLDAGRQDNRAFFLFLLDLDHFKSINDTLGHSAGDSVLMEVAARLTAAISVDHVVARLGGDEFAILAADRSAEASDDALARRLAEDLLAKACGPVMIDGRSVNVGVSIGIAKFPDDGTTANDMLASADLALYAAKDGGRQNWRRFDAILLAAARIERDIEHDLGAAIAQGELQVYFQPQIAANTDCLAGLEALLRWNHAQHGWISPAQVVAAARRIRISDLLTGFILDHACRLIGILRQSGFTEVLVAINISPSEIGHGTLLDLVQRAIDRHGIDPKLLELEITEETFAASDDALATLAALSALGVRLAIDDFGTGYSSIAYLRSMRVDRIKIDRSFVTGFAERMGDRILVQAILGIARAFGIEVVAEGVETAEEVGLLQAIGCDIMQGYYFGRPMMLSALEPWLAAYHEARRLSEERRDMFNLRAASGAA